MVHLVAVVLLSLQQRNMVEPSECMVEPCSPNEFCWLCCCSATTTSIVHMWLSRIEPQPAVK